LLSPNTADALEKNQFVTLVVPLPFVALLLLDSVLSSGVKRNYSKMRMKEKNG
jgi:hypothetical protein